MKKRCLTGAGLLIAGLFCLASMSGIQSMARQPVTVHTIGAQAAGTQAAGTAQQAMAPAADPEQKKQKQDDGSLMDDSWYLEKGAKLLHTYFALDIDPASCGVMVQYLPAMPEIGSEAGISVLIWPKGESDELTGKDLERSHNIELTMDGNIRSAFIRNQDAAKLDTPASVEDAKRIAAEFVKSRKLTGDFQPNCLGGAFITAEAISVGFSYDGEKSVELGVNSRTGQVYYFEYTTKERVMKRITPIKEGTGVG